MLFKTSKQKMQYSLKVIYLNVKIECGNSWTSMKTTLLVTSHVTLAVPIVESHQKANDLPLLALVENAYPTSKRRKQRFSFNWACMHKYESSSKIWKSVGCFDTRKGGNQRTISWKIFSMATCTSRKQPLVNCSATRTILRSSSGICKDNKK